jgi:tetraacyldisaccharide 4'-kinase
MLEKAQQYLLDVVEERRQSRTAVVVKALLNAASKLYYLAVQARVRLFRGGILRSHSLGVTVISVGNITMGGTGKTPVVEMLAAKLNEGGRKVAILTRGYKRKTPLFKRLLHYSLADEPKVVSDGTRLLVSSREAGDEPYMLAKNLDGVFVVVGKNRIKSGNYAIRKLGADTLILDDGFQYLPLRRQHDIVLIDSTNPFGNNYVIPRGTLREPLKNLQRANYVMLTKSNGNVNRLRLQVRALNKDAEIIETRHTPQHFEEVHTAARHDLGFIKGKRVFVVSGIARPQSFEDTIQGLGVNVIERFRFLDHHRFTYEEMEEILNRAREEKIDAVVTTEKDAVRMPVMEKYKTPIYFLRVSIEIMNGHTDLQEFISSLCYS